MLTAHAHQPSCTGHKTPHTQEAALQQANATHLRRAALHALAGGAASWYCAAAVPVVGLQLAGALAPPGTPVPVLLAAAFMLHAAGENERAGWWKLGW